MADVSKGRLKIWIYRELLGSLSDRKKKLLKEALDEKQVNNELDSLERRIWSAITIYPDSVRKQREFLKKELKAWEQRAAL